MSLKEDEMTMKQWEYRPERVKKMVKTVESYSGTEGDTSMVRYSTKFVKLEGVGAKEAN